MIAEPETGTDIFDGEVDVAPTRPRFAPVVVALIGLGIAFGLIAAVILSAGILAGSWFKGAVVTATFGGSLSSVAAVETETGVDLPSGSRVQAPVDESLTVIAQVALPADAADPFAGSEYTEVSDVPRYLLRIWGDDLEDPRYYVTPDGDAALTGICDGARVISFTEPAE